jgi:hypothetical protein
MLPAFISDVQVQCLQHQSVLYLISIFYSWFSFQAKADEIAKLMNEQFKALIEDLEVYLFFQYIIVRIMLCFNTQFFLIQSTDQKKDKRNSFSN